MKKRRIGIMDIEIRLSKSSSLKEKRNLKRSIIDRFKKRYNISIIETGQQETNHFLQLTLSFVALNESSALNYQQKLMDELTVLVDNYNGYLEVQFDII